MCDEICELNNIESIKCMIVGNSKTGKTSLFKAILGEPLPNDYLPTVFDVSNKEIQYNGNKVNLALWDSAGSNFYDTIRPISYAHTDCFIVCFGVDNRTSFESVKERWLPEIIRHGDGPKVPVILVGTVSDIPEEKIDTGSPHYANIVMESEIDEMREKVKAHAHFMFSLSGKSEDVQQILEKMTELACLKKIDEEKPPNPIWNFQSLNIILTGDVGVGKTAIIEKCIQKSQRMPVQKGSHFHKLQEYYHDFVRDGCEYFLRIIELPFGNDYLGTLYELCEQTDLIIVCYAINDPFSFQSVGLQYNSILKNSSKEVPTILIGNKSDLKETSDIVIPTEDGKELMDQLKCAAFIECSAKTTDSISSILDSVASVFKNDSTKL